MAYRINSPNQQELYQIDQQRLNRLQGAEQDYELAQIQRDHPDWTPTQVRMAKDGKIAGSPDTTRLVEGYGLSPNYRITGADPMENPPYSAVNPRMRGGGNTLENSFARQQNAFRLGQISKAQTQLDKLDPEDDNYDTRKSELEGRINALTEESSAGGPVVKPEAAIPLGKGTAGEVADVYKAGGPGSFRRLSNGGSVYFGPVGGRPIDDAPPSGTIPAGPESAAVMPSPPPAPSGPPAVASSPWMIARRFLFGSPDQAPSTNAIPNISTAKIALRNKLQSQQKALEAAEAPPELIGSASNRVYRIDNSVTNAPAFRAGPMSQSAIDQAPAALPDYGTPAPAPTAPKGIPVRNKKTGQTGLQMPDGTIIPDQPQ